MAEKPKVFIHEKWTGTCPESMVCVDACKGNIILIFNIISPGTGTLIASCLDEQGCNCQTVLLSILQALLVPLCFVGWIWAIKWSCDVKTWNAARIAAAP